MAATILLVDDYVDLRDGIEEVLSQAGYRVFAVSDAEAALGAARDHPGEIDILVTDITLPGMLGRELAARLRAQHPNMRVLLMSGSAAPPEGTRTETGAKEWFIQKPFMFDELVRTVRDVLGSD